MRNFKLKVLRAVMWLLGFRKGNAPRLDDYYAKEKLQPWRSGQSISPAKVLNVPAVWRSSPDHVIAYLTYISADEAALLAALDMHGSGVSRKMHFGPLAIPSYQGDGSSGSDGGGPDGGGENDDDDESTAESQSQSGNDYGVSPDVGFDTPESIMAEANYGIGPGEFGGLEGQADTTGPTGSGEALQASGIPADVPQQSPATILGSILAAPPPPEMPMPENSSARLARRRSAREQSRRRGRGSTILTSLDPLGGS